MTEWIAEEIANDSNNMYGLTAQADSELARLR
jgi:hypothetical protein